MRFLLALLLLPLILAANETGDVSLETIIPDEVYANVTYDALFKVENERHVTGETVAITVEVAYNVTRNGSLVSNDTFVKVINKYSRTGTGSLRLEEVGDYVLCGRIVNATVIDGNHSNDAACAGLSVSDPFAAPCNVSLELRLEERVYEEGEPVLFVNDVVRHDDGELPPFIVRYGVRSLFNDSLRVMTTTNEREKRYTPKLDGPFGAFVFYNEFELLACDNANRETADEAVVVVRGAPGTVVTDSSVAVAELNDPKGGFVFGDEVRVTVDVYRGATRKRSLKLYVEDDRGKKVSYTTSLTAERQYEGFTVTLPVRLHPYATLATGTYAVVLEGLGERDERPVRIQRKKSAAKNDTTLELESFYTRAKRPAAELTVYALVKGSGEAEFELVTANATRAWTRRVGGRLSLRENVTLLPGPNLVALRLYEGGALRAERSLVAQGPVPEACPAPAPCQVLACPACPAPAETTVAAAPPPVTGAVVAGESPAVPAFAALVGAALLALVLLRQQ